MAKDTKRLAEIFEYQREQGKGNIASLTRAMLDLRKEQRDIRNRLFGAPGKAPKGIAQALFRSVLGPGFSATSSKNINRPEKIDESKSNMAAHQEMVKKIENGLSDIRKGLFDLKSEVIRFVDAQKDNNREIRAVRIAIEKTLSKRQKSSYDLEREKDEKALKEREKEIEASRVETKAREDLEEKAKTGEKSKSSDGGFLSNILGFLSPVMGFGSSLISGLFGAASGLMSGGMTIATSLFSGLFKGAGLGIAGLFGVLGFMGSAFKSLGLIGSLITFFILKKLFEGTKFGDSLDAFGDAVSNFFTNLLTALGLDSNLETGKLKITENLTEAFEYLKNSDLKTIFNDIVQSLKDIAKSVKEFKFPTLEELNTKIDKLFSDIRTDIQKSIFIVTETIQEYIKAFAQNLQVELLNWFDENKELLIKSIAMTVGAVAGSLFGVSGAALGAGAGAAGAEISKLFGGQNMSKEQRKQRIKELEQQKDKKVIPERMDLESWAKQYDYTDILKTLEDIGDVDKDDKTAQKKLTDQLKNQIKQRGFPEAQIAISGREFGLSEGGIPQLEPKLEIFGPGIGLKADNIEELKSKLESAKKLGDTDALEEITKRIQEEEKGRAEIDKEISTLKKEEKLRTPIPYDNIIEDVKKRADEIYEPKTYYESGTMGGYSPPGPPTPVVRQNEDKIFPLNETEQISKPIPLGENNYSRDAEISPRENIGSQGESETFALNRIEEMPTPIPLGENNYSRGLEISPYSDSGNAFRENIGPQRELEPIIMPEAPSPQRKAPFRIRSINIPGLDFEKYKMVVGDIESTNNYGITNKIGMLGRYQMGAQALFDAGYVTVRNNSQLNDPKNWNGPIAQLNNIRSKEDFLRSPAAQDDAFAYFTNANYKSLKSAGLIGSVLKDNDVVELASAGYGVQNAINYWKYGKELTGSAKRNNPRGMKGYVNEFTKRWSGQIQVAQPTEKPVESEDSFFETVRNLAQGVVDSFVQSFTGKSADNKRTAETLTDTPVDNMQQLYPHYVTNRESGRQNSNEPVSSLYEPSILPSDITSRARTNEPPLKTLKQVYPEQVVDRNASQVILPPKFNIDSFKPVKESMGDAGATIVNVFNEAMKQIQPAVNESINSVDMESLKDIFNSSMMRYTYSYL